MASSSEDDDIKLGDCVGDAGRGGGGDGSEARPGFDSNSGSSSIYYMYLLFYVSSIYVGSPVAIKPI